MPLEQLPLWGGDPKQGEFWNTTKLDSKDLLAGETNAKQQSAGVIQIFADKSPLSPRQCHAIFEKRYGIVLLQSIRRSICNLTKKGKLAKTSVKIKGPFGKWHVEYVWKINPEAVEEK